MVWERSVILRTSLILAAVLLGLVLLAACSNEPGAKTANAPGSGIEPGGMMDEGMREGGRDGPSSDMSGGGGQNVSPGSTSEPIQASDGEADLRNGERIYFTATTEGGERIGYRGGPDFGGMMMGGYLTCAACHGPGAQGGTHQMHMEIMDAPAITYDALSGESGEHADEAGDEHGAYDLETFRMAVVEGRHPDGEALSDEMPRWDISEDNLQDLFAFLKSISPPEGE